MRKQLFIERVRFEFILEKQDLEKLNQYAKKNDFTPSEILRRYIKKLPKPKTTTKY